MQSLTCCPPGQADGSADGGAGHALLRPGVFAAPHVGRGNGHWGKVDAPMQLSALLHMTRNRPCVRVSLYSVYRAIEPGMCGVCMTSVHCNTSQAFVAVALLGMGLSTLYPMGIMLAEEKLSVTGSWISVFISGGTIGSVVLPLLVGLLLAKAPLALPWAETVFIVSQLLCWLVVKSMPTKILPGTAISPEANIQLTMQSGDEGMVTSPVHSVDSTDA